MLWEKKKKRTNKKITSGVEKEVYQGQIRRLCSSILHYLCWDSGDSEPQRLSPCQFFLVASFPQEGRLCCTPIIPKHQRISLPRKREDLFSHISISKKSHKQGVLGMVNPYFKRACEGRQIFLSFKAHLKFCK